MHTTLYARRKSTQKCRRGESLTETHALFTVPWFVETDSQLQVQNVVCLGHNVG